MSFLVPDACTLPTAEQPVRTAEFDTLFAAAVREVETVSPTHVRLRMAGPPDLAASVRDLTARETECCSFFTFTAVVTEGESLTLDIQVPPAHTDVLAALTQRARVTTPQPSDALPADSSNRSHAHSTGRAGTDSTGRAGTDSTGRGGTDSTGRAGR